jgi:hypothetical protein
MARRSIKDWTVIRERYLRDALPVRLGGLATNLARIKSFSSHVANREVVESLFDESKLFIEWTAADAEVNVAAELVELQVQLALWQRNWANIWADAAQRMKVVEQARVWSERVLNMSGLLRENPYKGTRNIKKVYNKVSIDKQKTDFTYWQTQSYEVRLVALEEIRQEYHYWKYGAEPRLQRVYTIVKR